MAASQDDGEEEGGLLPGGWLDEEERKTLLAGCQPGQPDEELVAALVQVRDKASLPENQEALWADAELRSALLACAEPPDPDFGKDPFAEEEPDPPSDLARTVAVSVLVCLAGSPVNRPEMAEDRRVRNVLVGAVDEARPAGLRHRAFLGLSSLALGGACVEPGDNDADSRPATPKLCLACGLNPCVCTAGDAVDRSSDRDVCNALVLGTARGQPVSVRAGVLGTVWSLALLSGNNAASLWCNRQLRQALLDGAALGEPADVRFAALGALWAFTACADLQVQMWCDVHVRQALLASAAADGEVDGRPQRQLEDARSQALSALVNLATDASNQAPMWRNGRLAAVLLRTVSAGGPLRREALRVLVELTKHSENLQAMLEAGVPELLAAALEDRALDTEDRRNCGFARGRLVGEATRATSWTRQRRT